MLTRMLPFHKKLLAEGGKKRGIEAVNTKKIRPDKHSDDPGLIYVYP